MVKFISVCGAKNLTVTSLPHRQECLCYLRMTYYLFPNAIFLRKSKIYNLQSIVLRASCIVLRVLSIGIRIGTAFDIDCDTDSDADIYYLSPITHHLSPLLPLTQIKVRP